jgi:hypothetical protein
LPSFFVVAAYIWVRLWPTHQLVGVARCRSLSVATPLSGFRAPGIWAFLSSLRKKTFFQEIVKNEERKEKKHARQNNVNHFRSGRSQLLAWPTTGVGPERKTLSDPADQLFDLF